MSSLLLPHSAWRKPIRKRRGLEVDVDKLLAEVQQAIPAFSVSDTSYPSFSSTRASALSNAVRIYADAATLYDQDVDISVVERFLLAYVRPLVQMRDADVFRACSFRSSAPPPPAEDSWLPRGMRQEVDEAVAQHRREQRHHAMMANTRSVTKLVAATKPTKIMFDISPGAFECNFGEDERDNLASQFAAASRVRSARTAVHVAALLWGLPAANVTAACAVVPKWFANALSGILVPVATVKGDISNAQVRLVEQLADSLPFDEAVQTAGAALA